MEKCNQYAGLFGIIDLFPPTAETLKMVVDQVGRTERANEIHSVLSCHTECVVLMSGVEKHCAVKGDDNKWFC